MARFRTVQTSLGRGELDPLLEFHSELQAYRNGLKTCRNVSMKPQGAGRRRPPTRRIADIGTADCELWDYVFSDSQKYVLAFKNASLEIYDRDGTLLTTLVGPWSTSQLDTLYVTYNKNTIIVSHPDVVTQKITRTGASSFTIGNLTYEVTGTGPGISKEPRCKYADDDVTITPSAAAVGAVTLTASAPVFTAGYIGQRIYYKGKQITISGFTDTTHLTGTNNEALGGTAAETDWTETAFNAMRGYPAVTAFHDRRLMLAGAKSYVDGIWYSKVDAPFYFELGTGADADAIFAPIDSEGLNQVVGIMSGRHLQIFTNEAEWYVPTSESRPLTPANVSYRKQTPFGSRQIKPVIFDGATLFFQKASNVLREFLFTDTEQAYSSESVSLLSGHLVNDPQDIQVVFGGTAQPDFFAIILNGDGTLAQFQSIRAEEIAGWTPWETDGFFHSITALDDDLFALVEREIAGVTKYFLERFEWDENWTLDCGQYASAGSPQATWTGFDAYNGQQVHVVSGDYYMGTVTPSGGSFTLNDLVDEVLVGFDFNVVIEPMPPDADLGNGPITGEVKRIVRTVLGLRDTMSIAVNGQPLILRKVTDDLSQPPASFSGKREFWLNGWGRSQTITITQPVPLRMTLLGMQMEVEV
jgi:hypothetical protein